MKKNSSAKKSKIGNIFIIGALIGGISVCVATWIKHKRKNMHQNASQQFSPSHNQKIKRDSNKENKEASRELPKCNSPEWERNTQDSTLM